MSLALGPLICPDPDLHLTVEIALATTASGYATWDVARWDTGTWGPDEIWTDVSDYVRSISTSRSFADDWVTWQTGTCTVVLSNEDGRFSPANLSGPYAPGGITQLIPGRPIRATLTHAGIVYPLYRGWITPAWVEGFQLYGPRAGDAIVTVACCDAWREISNLPALEAVAPAGTGETFGPRVSRILTAAGYSGSTDLDTGVVALQATDLSAKPAEELVDTTASEGGTLHVDAAGAIVGRGRYTLGERARSVTPQITWGDGGGTETPWTEIATAPFTLENLVNIAAYTRVGGTQQVYRDEESIALYGAYADGSSWADKLLCQSDAEVLALAQWTTVRTPPEISVESLTVKPLSVLGILPQILDTQMWDLHSVTIRPPSTWAHTISRECFVSGISWTIEGGDVTVKYLYAPAGAYRPYARSRWDVGLWGSSDSDPAGALWFF